VLGVGNPTRQYTIAATTASRSAAASPIRRLHQLHSTTGHVRLFSPHTAEALTAAHPTDALMPSVTSAKLPIATAANGPSSELITPSDRDAAAVEWADSLLDESPAMNSAQTDSSQSGVSRLLQSAAAHEDLDAPRCLSPIFGIQQSQAAAASTEQVQGDAASAEQQQATGITTVTEQAQHAAAPMSPMSPSAASECSAASCSELMALLDAGLQESPIPPHSCCAANGTLDSQQARHRSSPAFPSCSSLPGVQDAGLGSMSMSLHPDHDLLGSTHGTPLSGSLQSTFGSSSSSSARLFSTPQAGLRPGAPASPSLFELMELDQGGSPGWETALFGPPILLEPDIDLLGSSGSPQAAHLPAGIDWDNLGLQLDMAHTSSPHSTAEAEFSFMNGSTAAGLQQRADPPTDLSGSPHTGGGDSSEQAVDGTDHVALSQHAPQPDLHPALASPPAHQAHHGIDDAGAAVDVG